MIEDKSTRSPDRAIEQLLERLAVASSRESGERQPSTQGPDITLPSEDFLQIVAQIAHVGAAVCDHQLDRDIFVSEEFARIHGFTRADYIERICGTEEYVNLIVPEDREAYLKYEIQFALDRSLEPSSIEYRICIANNEIRQVKQISRFVQSEQDIPHQSLCLIQDITSYRRMEAKLSESTIALEESESLLAQSASMTKTGYCIWDTESESYLTVSDEWATIFGYSRQEFLSKFPTRWEDEKLIHPMDRDRYAEFYVIEGSSPGYSDIEYRILRKDGEVRHVLERIGGERITESGSRGRFITLQDISERKIAEAQIIQASKLSTLGEMATGLAHELNQPLNTISLAASNMELALGNESPDPNLLLKKLVRIKDQVSRASTIIDHIRTFGRDAVESDQIFDLKLAVLGAIDLVAERLKLAQIHIETHFDPKCSAVSGHPIQMEQVILNLISNSIHALEQCDSGSRQITFKTSQAANDTVVLRVSDSGGGIPEKVLPRLFEPFVTTKGVGEGTGLGLSISHGIIKRMRGQMFARNDEKGAVFELVLPPAEQTPA